MLNRPKDKARLTPIRDDLDWWIFWLKEGSNVRYIWPFAHQSQVETDASQTAGGAFHRGQWFYANWRTDFPEMALHHINTKELATVVVAGNRWGHLWSGQHVTVKTDNTVTEHIINNGTASNKTCLALLKDLADLSLKFNFTISAIHVPGRLNVLADAISRLHEPKVLDKLCKLLCIDPNTIYWPNHVSPSAWLFLDRCCRAEAGSPGPRGGNVASHVICRDNENNIRYPSTVLPALL